MLDVCARLRGPRLRPAGVVQEPHGGASAGARKRSLVDHLDLESIRIVRDGRLVGREGLQRTSRKLRHHQRIEGILVRLGGRTIPASLVDLRMCSDPAAKLPPSLNETRPGPRRSDHHAAVQVWLPPQWRQVVEAGPFPEPAPVIRIRIGADTPDSRSLNERLQRPGDHNITVDHEDNFGRSRSRPGRLPERGPGDRHRGCGHELALAGECGALGWREPGIQDKDRLGVPRKSERVDEPGEAEKIRRIRDGVEGDVHAGHRQEKPRATCPGLFGDRVGVEIRRRSSCSGGERTLHRPFRRGRWPGASS